MPVELCACARAMDPSRRAYRAPLLQSLNTHRLAPTPLPKGQPGLQPGSIFQPWVTTRPGRYFSRGLGRRADPGRL
jgi:hypothetical protein